MRGWVLYVAFNEIENHMTRGRFNLESCWYRPWLELTQSECYGRLFDFSDHVVLYFGQILPIAFMEVLYAFERPYWMTTSNSWYPKLLAGVMLYLYYITLSGAYKTALYFHTGPEVLGGFAVSLLIHIPMYCIQCCVRCERLRSYIFR